MVRLTLSFLVFLALPLWAQTKGEGCCMGATRTAEAAPVASNPVVDVTGTIAEVHISPGQGMPYLEVKRGSETTRLYLGAMHYLIAEDFNPKTGQQVVAKGYKMTQGVIGIEVRLPTEKKTLKLRDSKGWPLWRGGPGRQDAATATPQ